jgi:hypothetical protein
MKTYRITRTFFNDKPSEVIATGLSLEAAQEHCRDNETSSSTCKEPENVARTEKFGPWFDGYNEETEPVHRRRPRYVALTYDPEAVCGSLAAKFSVFGPFTGYDEAVARTEKIAAENGDDFEVLLLQEPERPWFE